MADSKYEVVGEWCVRCHAEDCVTLRNVLEGRANVIYSLGGFDEVINTVNKCHKDGTFLKCRLCFVLILIQN